MDSKDLFYSIGILIAISLALCSFIRPQSEGLENKIRIDSSPEWFLDVDKNTKTLNFIHQGHLKGTGKKENVMSLTTDGILTLNKGLSFRKPKDQSWKIIPDENNSLFFTNIAGGGIKLNSTGSILPLKHHNGGPMDFSKMCIKEDGTNKVYSNLC